MGRHEMKRCIVPDKLCHIHCLPLCAYALYRIWVQCWYFSLSRQWL